MTSDDGSPADEACPAVAALRTGLADTDGRLRDLLDEAVAHLDTVLRSRPVESVAAVAVPAAVWRCLSRAVVPVGVLAAASATYLAFDVLDDLADGDERGCWRARTPTEAMIGSQVLLLTASRVVGLGAPTVAADRLEGVYATMIAQVAEGELRSARQTLTETSPADIEATIDLRSGAMLAGFAEVAAVAAGADARLVEAARRYGRSLALARQHVNDLTELVSDRTSDLRNRTATMAPALALQSRPVEDRRALTDQLHAAAEDPVARRALLERELAPAIGQVVTLVHLHLAEARVQAGLLSRGGIGHDDLDRLIELTADPLRRRDVH